MLDFALALQAIIETLAIDTRGEFEFTESTTWSRHILSWRRTRLSRSTFTLRLEADMTSASAVVKSFHSPDVFDLESYAPEDPERFAFLLEFTAGVGDGSPGGDDFHVVVCTPAWLADKVRRIGRTGPRHHLLVRSYDWRAIEVFVTSYVRSCSGSTWEEVAQKIGRLAHWEFEDYREPAS